MSEGGVQPPKAAVPESHTVDTFQVPKAFHKYALKDHPSEASS